MKTVIIDNYDSFTYNLVHYIEEINNERPDVFRNDQFEIEQLKSYDIIVLSPGPGLPENSGLLMTVLSTYADSKIILGVCLGHQAIGMHFGAKLENLSQVYHGVDCSLKLLSDDFLFTGINTPTVGRYHSWVINNIDLPSQLEVTSEDELGNIMSIRHRKLPIHGIQFHPESVLTPEGKSMLTNFFNHYNQSWQG